MSFDFVLRYNFFFLTNEPVMKIMRSLKWEEEMGNAPERYIR